MIFDERTYTLHPGRTDAYFELYEAEGYDIQIRHLGQPWGYFSTEIGVLNQVVHIWRYASLDDRMQRRASLQINPDWQAYTAKVFPLIARMENRILRAAPFFHVPAT